MRKVLFSVVLCAVLGACAHTDVSQPVAVAPARVGEANTIDVHVNGATPATAHVDMPDMQMSTKTYRLERIDSSTYEATNVTFSMAGTWRVTVLSRDGVRVARMTFTVR